MNDSVGISDLTLNTGDAELSLTGNVINKDSALLDISFNGSDIDIAKNLSILPSHMMEELNITGAAGMLHFNGNAHGFLTSYTMPQVEMDVRLTDGFVQYDTYPSVRHIQMEANFSNGYVAKMESSLVNLKRFHAETEKSSIDLSAKIMHPLKPQYDIAGSVAIDLGEWKSMMPDSLVKSVSGRLKASVSTAGVLPDSITDDFSEYFLQRTRFNLQLDQVGLQMDSIPQIIGLGGTLIYSPKNLTLSAFRMQVPDYHVHITNGYFRGSWLGKISDYENMSLQMDSLLLATSYSSFSASGQVEGLKTIKYDLSSDLSLNLSEVYEMMPDSMAHSMSGAIDASLCSAGIFAMDSMVEESMRLFFENSKLGIHMKDVSMDMQDTLLNVQNLSGSVIYHSDSIWMNRVSGSYLGLDFGADSTTVSHVYSGAVQNNKKEIRVHGNFEVGDMDYAWIEAFMGDTVPEPEELTQAKMQAALEEEPYEQHYTIKANGHMKARSFKYGDILLKNIDAKFLADLENNFFVADSLVCDVFDGQVNGALRYRMVDLPTDTVLRDVMDFKIDAENLDVSKMVSGLQEYIQEYDITGENVKGFLSSDLDGRIVMENYMPVFDSLMISGDLTLDEGALIGVKAIAELQDLPGIGIKNLDNLRFRTLSSSLFIYRNNIFLPKTDIYSSSFEASLLGMYSFNGDYDFHIRAILSQILSGKVSKPSKEEQKGGFASDDKGRYYVTSYLDGKSKAWFDNKSDRERMDTRIRMNKRGLMVLFKPVLVRYETDVK
ncbi:hypothetical protein [Saccharicrinis fermentans]|uniref:AsmA-like C-terminal domain-containing protein n=1 Tax=Saccharicrinis fermentans DSM 9555 = JCM 21142 TaxID=869213 RepID=W7Y7E8_9BACT|nr:hypothetical protein [Saccharicrinis fermentans]GAF03568.1 hypothetical protein JCM21142_52246 [Saccharicrinis fermentans DSM 9555 = JCM 21142]